MPRSEPVVTFAGFEPFVRLLRTGLLLILFAAVASGCTGDSAPRDTTPEPRKVVYRTQTMGTVGGVTLVTADSLASLPQAYLVAEAWQHVDSLMSNWTETSEVARINRDVGTTAQAIAPEVSKVLETALAISEASGGAFDVTVEPLVRLWGFLGGEKRVPEAAEIRNVLGRVGYANVRLDAEGSQLSFARDGVRIDLGGVAKGYGVDLAAGALRAAGVGQALLDLSGNMAAIGAPFGRGHWIVGVRDPRGEYPYFAKLKLREACIATSGNYEQFVAQDGKKYGHILDPRTGWPTEGLLSATVIASSAMEADAWATALIVMGREEALRRVHDRRDLHAILVEPGSASTASGEEHAGGASAQDGGGRRDVVWVSEELGDLFSLDADKTTQFEVRRF